MDYDDLVKYLLDIREEEAADAITKLRAERDNAIAECVMHIGNAKALRDRLNWFEEAGGVAMATRIYQVIGERDALAALLRELDETWIRSTCPQSIRDRIDAALAGKDAP